MLNNYLSERLSVNSRLLGFCGVKIYTHTFHCTGGSLSLAPVLFKGELYCMEVVGGSSGNFVKFPFLHLHEDGGISTWTLSIILHNLPHSLSYSRERFLLSVVGEMKSCYKVPLLETFWTASVRFIAVEWWGSFFLPLSHMCPSPVSTIFALVTGKPTYFLGGRRFINNDPQIIGGDPTHSQLILWVSSTVLPQSLEQPFSILLPWRNYQNNFGLPVNLCIKIIRVIIQGALGLSGSRCNVIIITNVLFSTEWYFPVDLFILSNY